MRKAKTYSKAGLDIYQQIILDMDKYEELETAEK